jgi:molecular chaperone DnaK
MSGAILGIDLGTTNSVVATLDGAGVVTVLRNPLGDETTPSVVYFDGPTSAIVGSTARDEASLDPENGIELIKRAMGTDHPVIVRGEHHTPESVSALILRHLVSVVPDPSPQVVITVPAYFGTAEREATFQAGRIAGLQVLELLDEPVAAAIHSGLTAGGDRNVLVYDLGGGTFDATVLRIAGGDARVVATTGHAHLGGADVDARLLAIVLSRVEVEVDEDVHDEFVSDERLLGQLRLDVEQVKRELSSSAARDLVVRLTGDRVRVSVTRTDLEAACADLFDTTEALITELLATASTKGVERIDDVVMVGGSSRIPMLADRLQALLGSRPRLVEPDLAVAKGAALRAHQLTASQQWGALTALVAQSQPLIDGRPRAAVSEVVPACPRAIGIGVEDSYDPCGERSFVHHVIDPHTNLPVDREVRDLGTILENQDTVRIQVYEQAGSRPSRELEDNRRVLDGELTGLGALPAGSVIHLNVRLAVDGRLTVVAREPRSGRELTLEAFMEGVVDGEETDRLTAAVGLIEVRA